ncbi:hypothetical protein OOK60_17155 [Trichothermofontia sichuanensis B231]|nr:hypothetical protein [Trichothermofontia sichuanensis]UZQ54188.1 hypothetical protein OOK60_17155 [Trichothermofontia sichuanensis B231]
MITVIGVMIVEVMIVEVMIVAIVVNYAASHRRRLFAHTRAWG